MDSRDARIAELEAALADAEAAQAVVVERAARAGADIAQRTRPDGFPEEASNAYHSGAMDVVDAIRALADTDGLALVQELRDRERESAMQALASMGQAQEAYEAQLKAEAERDRLSAANAALEAQVARLVGALRLYSCEDGCNDCPEHERDRVGCGWTARAALAEVRAQP